MIQKTTDKSAILQSGICSSDPSIVLSAGNTVVNLPFWKNLTGDDEVLSDSSDMGVSKITTGKDLATVHLRGKAWSANDLASLLAGDNAMTAIANKSADFWAKQIQTVLVKTLAGATAINAFAGHVNNISATNGDGGVISANAMIDTISLMGDSYSELEGIMMHSAVMFKLLKEDLITTIPASDGKDAIYTYMGKRVIVDDMLAPTDIRSEGAETAVWAYPIYFFGNGSIAYNEGTGVVNVETDRDKLAGDDYLITRRQFTMHPRGIAWHPAESVPVGVTPSNAELADSGNWSLVEDLKNVAITKLVARIA